MRYALGTVLAGSLLLGTACGERHYYRQYPYYQTYPYAGPYYYPHDGQYYRWNRSQERAYRHWLHERNEHYRQFNQLPRRDQEEYWRWRSKHRH